VPAAGEARDVVAELATPGEGGDALAERVSAARRRIRDAYDGVIAAGGIAALAARS
jgi:broad specificity phosphatase PhoE